MGVRVCLGGNKEGAAENENAWRERVERSEGH